MFWLQVNAAEVKGPVRSECQPRNSSNNFKTFQDSEGVDYRSRIRLWKRKYFTKGPNYIWHVDDYRKLKPFGFVIHGAIDGYSRCILWVHVGPSNNNPIIIAK